jgi:hypothetical protein
VVLKIRRAPQETVFFALGVLLCGKSSSWRKSRAKAIKKKFKFKMNFKLKINIRSRENWLSPVMSLLTG